MKKRVSKGYKGIGMDGFIATWYADNRAKDIEDIRKDARRVAEYLTDGSRVLEIAPGPGYMAIELAKLGRYTITGVDISESFVRIARDKASTAKVSIDFRHGNASDLPLGSEAFDLTYCMAAFKNFSEPVKAIAEMHRVLRPGGTALIYDLRPDVTDEAIARYARNTHRGRLDSLLMKWTFKYFLARRAHSREQFREMAAATPFKTCEVHEDQSGMGYEVVLRRQLAREATKCREVGLGPNMWP